MGFYDYTKYLKLGLDDAYKEYFPEVGNIVEIERKSNGGRCVL